MAGVRAHIRGCVPGLPSDQFGVLAERAGKVCPVNKALAGTAISMTAELG